MVCIWYLNQVQAIFIDKTRFYNELVMVFKLILNYNKE